MCSNHQPLGVTTSPWRCITTLGATREGLVDPECIQIGHVVFVRSQRGALQVPQREARHRQHALGERVCQACQQLVVAHVEAPVVSCTTTCTSPWRCNHTGGFEKHEARHDVLLPGALAHLGPRGGKGDPGGHPTRAHFGWRYCKAELLLQFAAAIEGRGWNHRHGGMWQDGAILAVVAVGGGRQAHEGVGLRRLQGDSTSPWRREAGPVPVARPSREGEGHARATREVRAIAVQSVDDRVDRGAGARPMGHQRHHAEHPKLGAQGRAVQFVDACRVLRGRVDGRVANGSSLVLSTVAPGIVISAK